MNMQKRVLALATAAAIVAISAANASAQSVEDGFKAWESGRHDEAVRQWRILADRNDADAQFALGHAYRLGRGVPQNMNLAEQWYERAARGGHREAQAMYGVLLFQNNRRREALPFIERGAEAGDPRAQYVLGTVLFNGDYLPVDHPRAYALMTRAAAQGLPQAQSHLAEMDRHISEEDRARGRELAESLIAQAPGPAAEMASLAASPATPAPPVTATPPRIATTDIPASRPVPAPTPPRARAPSSQAAAESPPPATGRWRIQLGAFSNEANARRAWDNVRGRLSGLQPYYVRAGALTRLQAGPLPDRGAAERSCSNVRQSGGACLLVAP